MGDGYITLSASHKVTIHTPHPPFGNFNAHQIPYMYVQYIICYVYVRTCTSLGGLPFSI